MSFLTVVYKNIEVGGQIIKRDETLLQPNIQLKRKPNMLYTLFMVDQDAEPKDFLHWLVVNIDRTNYHDVVPYYPPNPSSGTHTYAFYLCEQPKGLRLKPISGRQGFNTNQFILDNHLTPIDKKSFKVKANF
jgi:phosphatidylethanolamine-binding protein (PEBP) family uncharacterized protein